jgi:ABC-type arginine transport system ATPase subunit
MRVLPVGIGFAAFLPVGIKFSGQTRVSLGHVAMMDPQSVLFDRMHSIIFELAKLSEQRTNVGVE